MNESLQPIFATAHRQLKPRTPVPEITVDYFPFSGLNHTARFHDGRLIIRVSDIFTDAPREVVHSLALILLAKLYRKRVDSEYHRTYRIFILKGEIQERARIARTRRRTPRRRESQGRCFDLQMLFEKLNAQYFNGNIARPQLSWSQKKTRYVLGRYDSSLHTIYISRIFDSPSVPSFVVEYILFHEMLHIKHQSQVHDSRMIFHTREFKQEELRFSQYREAKLWLKQT